MQAIPPMTPARILSGLFVPIIFPTGSAPMRGREAVLPDRASNDNLGPGAIAPPSIAPLLSSANILRQVPTSMNMQGVGYLLFAATPPHTRSLPSTEGSSIFILSPVLIPGETIIGFTLQSFSIPFSSMGVIGDTTEEMIQPVIAAFSKP